MKILLDLKKSLEQNASTYFEKSKKAKKKCEGAREALEKSHIKKKREAKKTSAELDILEKKSQQKKKREKKWYEKFRWFISSDGFLVIGGRDSTSNEIVVKKHAEKSDIVFHTDMAGSPFIVVKAEGKDIPPSTLQEAADFTASFSRAWKKGLSTLSVFYVNPEQVSKETNPGEYMPKGAFMIRGKTNYLNPEMNIAIGLHKDKFMSGPIKAVKKHCKKHIEIMQGNKKKSEIAKLIRKKLGGDLDEIIRALPAGGCDVKT